MARSAASGRSSAPLDLARQRSPQAAADLAGLLSGAALELQQRLAIPCIQAITGGFAVLDPVAGAHYWSGGAIGVDAIDVDTR